MVLNFLHQDFKCLIIILFSNRSVKYNEIGEFPIKFVFYKNLIMLNFDLLKCFPKYSMIIYLISKF
jgi:hypothetical protein